MLLVWTGLNADDDGAEGVVEGRESVVGAELCSCVERQNDTSNLTLSDDDDKVDVSSELNRTIHQLDLIIQQLRDNVTRLHDQVRRHSFAILILFARACLLYTSPSPRDRQKSRMPSSA